MIESCIASAIDGRLRIRHLFIRDKDLAEAIFKFLKEQPLLNNIKVNPRSGSVLIEYDPEKISQDEIIFMLEEYAMSYCAEHGYLEQLMEYEENSKQSVTVNLDSLYEMFGMNKAQYRKIVRRGMLLFLSSAVILISFGLERGHFIVAAIYLALSASHIYMNRRML